ncbi:MAG: TolC family protein, partial [Bacteroidota bacterium]
MSMKINFLFLLCLCSFSLFSQEVWDLERCILYAQQNSLNMQQAQVDIKQAQVENQGNKLARLPNLNAGTTGQLNFGKTVDFTTNTFASEARSNQSLFLSTNVVLYNGGRIRNSIKQSQFNIEAASADADDIANNMALQVATAYLNILLAEEQLANSQKRAEQTQQQLSQTDKLISAGTRPEADRLDIVAQLARDEQAIVTQSNSVDIAYLSLKQLLELPPDYDLIISRPDIVVPVANPENFNLTEVYALALRTQPQIKAGEMRMMAAKVDMDLARSNILPSVTFFASLNSNISSIAQDFTNPNTDNVFTVFEEGPVIINGEDAILATPEVRGVTFPNATYIDQLNDNFGQGIGFSIDVPICNLCSSAIV